MKLGVDFSQHGGPLALSTVECWKSTGVKYAIVQYSSRMPQHLATLNQAGNIEIEAYVYLYWGLDPWGQSPQVRTSNAIAMMRGLPVRRLWLDCEDSTHPYREDQLRDCATICEQAGLPTGIYTGRWWWAPQTNNSHSFAQLPLWHAQYLGQAPTPDLSKLPRDFSSFVPYGGWTTPTIWQWWNTTNLCGHSVDLNAMEDDVPSQEELIGRVVEALVNKYRVELVGTNPIGEWVVEVKNGDGTPADPPIFMAVLAEGQTRG